MNDITIPGKYGIRLTKGSGTLPTIKDRPTYVVLQPHSNSNPTRFYRVVSMRAWVAHAYQVGTDTPAPAGTQFETYEAAKAWRDDLNRPRQY